MTYPTKPDAAYDYSAFQASQPATPLPGNQVDNDFANHKTAIDALVDFLKIFSTSTGRITASAVPGAEDLSAYTAESAASATAAAASATDAATSATNAAASVVAAESIAGSINSTSTTSVAIATGSQSFTTQTSKNFAIGGWVTIASVADTTNFMFGQITAYNISSGALVVTVTAVGGSGTKNDWTISVAGIQGAAGAKGDTGSPGASGSGNTGDVSFFHGRIADIPAGKLPMNGAAVSRVTYSALFALLVKSATFTITIASPGVVSWTSHGLDDGDPFVAATDGALPTGVTAGTTYYVKAVGANSFQLSATPGGAAVTTTGSQSGTHTATSALCGLGNGSTTFNTPDWRGVTPIGHDMMGSSAAGALTFANEGIYGRGAGIDGDNSSVVVNVQHNHSYGSARLATGGTLWAALTQPVNDLGNPDPNYTSFTGGTIDNGGTGTTGNQGTASVRYKRIGRVAKGIWLITT